MMDIIVSAVVEPAFYRRSCKSFKSRTVVLHHNDMFFMGAHYLLIVGV